MAEETKGEPVEGSASIATHDDLVIQISGAIKKSRFDWRTPESIAKELGLPVDTVQITLEEKPQFIRSLVPSKNGKLLYTSNEKRENAGFASRFLSAWTNSNV
jgi:hypothetical protein